MSVDLATAYALDVHAGRVVAGRLVRQACARHLDDIEHQAERGLLWRAEEAEAVVEFFATVLCLPEEADAGEAPDDETAASGTPFTLAPWQAFVVGSLMGWYTQRGGRERRRFRTAYLETAKGSGKTPLCAGLLIYLAVMSEHGGQFFAAAATKDQAKIAFADCEKMVQASPYLRELFIGTVNNLAIPSTETFIRAISSEKRGLDGKRVSGAVLDELHEHPTAVVVNKIRKGIKGRKNALVLEPTNAGFDRTSVCWAHHEYSRKVLEGTIDAPDWFAFVCGLDPCEACMTAGKWFPDEECQQCDDWRTEGPHWLKSNPNLGVSLPWQYVRDLVRQATGMPSEVGDLLRFTFGVWTQGASRAIDMGRWSACRPFPSEGELAGVPCFGGLDMGETDDLCAWVVGWVLPDGRLAVKMRCWLPREALVRYPNRPYAEWERAKLLTVTDGDVTDFDVVRQGIVDDCDAYGVETVAYDVRSAVAIAQQLQSAGVDVVKAPRGYALHEAIERLLVLVRDGDLCHGGHKVLTWMASNAVIESGTQGDKKWTKARSPEKIDGIAALTNLVDYAIVRRVREPESMYLTEGVRTLGD